MGDNMNTVPRMLHHWATHQPDTAAFVFVDSTMRRRVLTRADVYRLAARFAAILRHNDVRRGDVVCNTLPNSPERVVSDFGIMLAGATAMNGQIFLADGADFIGSLRDSECNAVILDPLQPKGALSFLASLGKEELGNGAVRIKKLPTLSRIVHCYWEGQGETKSFMDMLEQHQDSYVADVTADDLACIWTTSGSTGFSKLIPQTHSSFLQISVRFSAACGLYHIPESFKTEKSAVPETGQLKPASSQDGTITTKTISFHNGKDAGSSHHTVLRTLKEDTSEVKRAATEGRVTNYAKHVIFNNGRLGWSAGFPANFIAAGATRVVVDLSRGPASDPMALIWAVVRQEQCNFVFLLPYLLQQLLSREDRWKTLPWKFNTLSVAGQPVHASLVQSAMEKITDSVIVFYGSSEYGSMTCKTVHDPVKYTDCNNGKPFPGIEVKIVDDDMNDVSLTSGKLGEIIVRPNIKLKGYINNEQATTEAVLPGGWFRTGDVGYFNDEGDLFVVCRTSFTIMRGAYLLHPGWLETRINTHPDVETVLVVPVPDPVLHQELCACVVTKPGASLTAEELREFCQTLFLTDSSDHMTAVPPFFLFFSALPTNATGKPCRHNAAMEARQRLGL